MESSVDSRRESWFERHSVDSERLLSIAAFFIPIAAVLYGALAFPISSPLAADTEYYFFVGRHFLEGLGLTDVDRTFFTAHGPLGPVTWAWVSQLGGESNVGPRLLGYFALATGLLVTVRIAQVLGGGRAALVCALALLIVPFFWETLGQLYLDQVQFALTAIAILLLLTPKRSNFIAAGAVLGIAILFKETCALVAVAPLAWMGAIPRRRLSGLYAWFLGALAIVILWWWILVWAKTGTVFPFDRLESAVGDIYLGAQWLIVGACLAFAGVFLLLERDDPRSRLLLLSWGALLPPVAITLVNHLATRQLLLWTALSAVFVGVVVSHGAKRFLPLVVAAAVVGIFLQGGHFKPEPLTSPGYQSLTKYLRSNHADENITAMWKNNRRIASKTGSIYFTELLSVATCPCDGRDLAKSRVPEQLASMKNELLILIRAERLARYLVDKFPQTYSIIWSSRREKADVLRVDTSNLPSAARLRTALSKFRQHLTNLEYGYNPAVTIKPFPFGDDGWDTR